MDAPPAARVGCGRSAPWLYVYELPDRYREGLRDPGNGMGTPSSLPLPPRWPEGVRLWNTAEFGLGDLILQRVRQYRCLTRNPERADLFYVPAFSARLHNRPTERAAEAPRTSAELGGTLRALYTRLERVRVGRCGALGAGVSNCSALTARGGADHVLVNPRNGAPNEHHALAELDLSDVR